MIQMKNSRRTTCTTWKRTVGAERVECPSGSAASQTKQPKLKATVE